MQQADWYFDFISPFSYFALLRLEELPGVTVRHRPVLLAGLLNHWGQKGPAEIATKRLWTYRSCNWYAESRGIPFRFPGAHPFNSLPYLRAAIAAQSKPDAIRTIFRALWTTGADAADPGFIDELLSELGIDRERLSSPQVKDRLRLETEQAVAQGVFGVPTLVVGRELFWGEDGMDFAKAYLADPAILATDEMRRVTDLPIGAARKAS